MICELTAEEIFTVRSAAGTTTVLSVSRQRRTSIRRKDIFAEHLKPFWPGRLWSEKGARNKD